MQLIIFYLMNNDFDENDNISDIINKAPEYLKIDNICSGFFIEEEAKKIKANKILSIFFFFEHLCFNDLCQTIQNIYKEKIDEDVKNKIKGKLLDKNNFNEDISIKELAAAVRRFISRYLVGNKQQADIDPKSMLLPQLKRVDLWDKKVKNLDNLGNLLLDLINEFKLNVGQSLSFYEIIKEEDEEEVNFEEEPEKEERQEKKKENKPQNKRRRRI